MKKKFGYLAILIIITAIALGGWYFLSRPKKKENMVLPPAIVSVAPVTQISRPLTVESVGTLIPSQQVDLTAEVSGYLSTINFDSGQYVKQGDMVLQLEDIKAKADYLSKASAYHFADLKYEREKKLLPLHVISQQDVDAAQTDKAAKLAEREMAQDQLNKMTIRAPFSGYLGKKTLNVGDYIQAGQPLVNLVDRAHLKVEYSISENYLSDIKIGQTVTLSSNAFPNQTFSGAVSFISPTVDPQTHMVTLQADIDNSNNLLAPGLFMQVKQIIKNEMIRVVPEQSIVRLPDKVVVYRMLDHKAVQTAIQEGSAKDGLTEVISGVSLNDRIITAGQQDLKDGQTVTVVHVPRDIEK